MNTLGFFDQKNSVNLPWYIEESRYKNNKQKEIDNGRYTTVVDGKENIRRSSLFTDHLVERLIDHVDTIPAMLLNSVKRFPDSECLGTRYSTGKMKTVDNPSDPNSGVKDVEIRPYKWETYSEVWEQVKFFGKGLIQIGVKPNEFVGVYSKNRREWLISLYGTYSQSMVNVAIYDTFGPEVLRYCCEDAKIGVVVAEACNLENILKACEKKRIEVLKSVIVIGSFNEETDKKFENVGIKLYTFDKIIQLGRENDEKCELTLPKPDTLATVMYTSGSTGDPKGVMLTHYNIIATISSVLLTVEIPGTGPIGTGDVYISYLPLSHILERVCCDAMMFVGAKIGFYSGEKRLLVDDLSELKPTLMALVPKVLSGMKEKIEKALSNENSIKQKIFEFGLKRQTVAVNQGERKGFWDMLVFNKIKKELGGKVRLIMSGGAPLSQELWEFAKVAFGCPVLQGYSLTETSAAGTITHVQDLELSAGAIVPSIEVKLVDWEEGGQTKNENGRGEIWIRGPSVFVGYYNKEEKTKEDLDSEGWFHTGDIGYFTNNGNLKIVDRKKNIFKLANGEYIPVEKLENTYSASELISQIFIHGESDQESLVAVVVPNKSKLEQWCGDNNKNFNNQEEFFSKEGNGEEFEKYVLEDIEKIAKGNNLKGPEVPKKVIISPITWNAENGLTTPTMKIKREALKEKFGEEIQKAYGNKETSKTK